MSKIDVILPTYNQSDLLDRAIYHILSQDFEDFTLIIVNDGSTDNTSAMCGEWTTMDERIVVIENKENKKLPFALNVGHAYGKSPYCTWISSDNISYKNQLSSLYNCIVDKYDFVQSNYYVIDKGIKSERNIKKIHSGWGYGNLYPSFLYKREVWETYHYDENEPYVEDLKFYLQALFHPFKFGYVNEYLMEYYIHEKSMTTELHKNLLEHNKRLDRLYTHIVKPYQERQKK